MQIGGVGGRKGGMKARIKDREGIPKKEAFTSHQQKGNKIYFSKSQGRIFRTKMLGYTDVNSVTCHLILLEWPYWSNEYNGLPA